MVSVRIILQCPEGVNRAAVLAPGWIVALLWIWGGILLLPARSAAEPVIEVTTHYYPVTVERVSQMQAAIDAATPLRDGETLYHGYTDSRVRWNWWWRRQEGLCRIERVESRVDIEYTLPRLRAATRNFRVRAIWSSWFWALKTHENNHGRHAIKTARRGEREIMAIEPHIDCNVVDRRASTIAASLVAELQAWDADYDRRTQHGRTETQAVFRSE